MESGTKLGHYEIGTLLGKGGMVYGEDFGGELQGRQADTPSSRQ